MPASIPAPAPPPPPAPAVEPADDDRPIRDLFQNLARDLWRLPSRDTGLLLAMGGGTALAVRSADDDLNNWAVDRGTAGYTKFGAVAGDGWIHGGLALGTYVTGYFADSPRMAHFGSDLIRAQALNAVVTRGLKLATQRHRPHGGGDSMPSGHTSASFATAAVVDAHFGWKAGVPAYALASFIGWSRIRDDRHWLSDVIIGGTLGAIAGRTVTAGHGDRQWVVVPAASADGAAVYVVRR